MNIGYARVSTKDQSLDLQVDALEEAGCEMIFHESISGGKSNRPELDKMISHLRKGDSVVVWKLDRLGRSIRDLIAAARARGRKGGRLLRETWRVKST